MGLCVLFYITLKFTKVDLIRRKIIFIDYEEWLYFITFDSMVVFIKFVAIVHLSI